MPPPDQGWPPAGLLDVRDDLATAGRLVTALWLAAQAPHLPEAERRALCELAIVCRERLEDCFAALDELIKPVGRLSAPRGPEHRR